MVNINLELNKKTELLFNELEKNLKTKKERIFNQLISGKKTLKELQFINQLVKRRNNPKRVLHSSEDIKKMIDNMN